MPTMKDYPEDLTDQQRVSMNVITLNTALNDLQSDVRKLNHVVLEGNGELPLREQVRNHQTFIVEIRYWSRFLLGVIVVEFIGLIVTGVFYVVRLLPILEQLSQGGR